MEKLLAIISRLRAPDGCAWDKKQDKVAICRHLREELYELLDAVEAGDVANEREEVGDVLFLLIFLTHLAAEQGEYNLGDAISCAQDKMVRRHPHIFAGVSVTGIEEIKANWQSIKQQEKGAAASFLMQAPPRSMPQLLRAQKVQDKAHQVGFDWDDVEGVLEKLEEEIGELRLALTDTAVEKRAEEVGDILFTAVNLGRFLGIDAEAALRCSTDKFVERFLEMETQMRAEGKDVATAGREELDEAWESIKRQGR